MSGNLHIGPPASVAPRVPAGQTQTGSNALSSASSRSFATVLAGSPAPAPGTAASLDPAQVRPLVPVAIQLTVGQPIGARLAAADMSVASWQPVTQRTVSPAVQGATPFQVSAVEPPATPNDRMSRMMAMRV